MRRKGSEAGNRESDNRSNLEIIMARGRKLIVERRARNREIVLRVRGNPDCLLHWGLCRTAHSSWSLPPKSLWPEKSSPRGNSALQTPFSFRNGEGRIVIRLDRDLPYSVLKFVLFSPAEGRWDNNRGRDYQIPLAGMGGPSPAEVLKAEWGPGPLAFEDRASLGEEARLVIAVKKGEGTYRVLLVTDHPGPLILHWGVAGRSRYEWLPPQESLFPPETVWHGKEAAQTPFARRDGLNRLSFAVPESGAPPGIPFVLKEPESGRWLKKKGRHFFIPLALLSGEDAGSIPYELSGAADEIIHAETGQNSWTLMHRFNLCHDLLEGTRHEVRGLALVYVWLRFSAIRQLTWQRNFNTKPAELSHAQNRLTLKLAEVFAEGDGEIREMARLITGTLGRGGEGQKIRDEILRIMHRHRIKEVSGRFMEEWHQKLHNNTTPDDVVICEAYLAFLRSNGDRSVFYSTLRAGGVSRERLRGFERPIVTDPDFVPYLKEDLIHDFGNYLKLLKSVHSGTDLDSAIQAARYLLNSGIGNLMDFLFRHKNDLSVPPEEMMARVVETRKGVERLLQMEREQGRVRDLLFLDLALEGFSRITVERSLSSGLNKRQLAELTGAALDNQRLSHDDPELLLCSTHWKRLLETPSMDRDWCLHAKSVLDRIGRAVVFFMDRYYALLQPWAETLGREFHADPWTITLFSEEVLRGRPAFALSTLLRHLDPFLRKTARLGDWQVVSPGSGSGRLEVVDHLRSVQGRTYNGPRVIVADHVGGDEDIPREITAVITPDVTDIVSHVAVRARNAHLLFATCYDPDTISLFKSLQGHSLRFQVNAAGDVEYREATGEPSRTRLPLPPPKLARPDHARLALAAEDFREGLVGGKALNLAKLRGRLPEWIRLPVSVALPFGVFEALLAHPGNKETAERYRKLSTGENTGTEENLAGIRRCVSDLRPTGDLMDSLHRAMAAAGLAWPEDGDAAWRCVTRVWASKWNRRAYLSRVSLGLPHEDLFMAVLIQQMVEADYAFVIHTRNPVTGYTGELYAEVVLGHGETLVGNYPGRALSFTCQRKNPEPRLLAYPGKSTGLYGGGLIFRSDSNGEDLAHYAGAGLYDSVLLKPPAEKALDYSREPLAWDPDFQKTLLTRIARIGFEVEDAMGGSPQDIEGASAGNQYYVVQTRAQVGNA